MRKITIFIILMIFISFLTGVILYNKYQNLTLVDSQNISIEKGDYRMTIYQVKPFYKVNETPEFQVELDYLGDNKDLVIGNVGGVFRKSLYYLDEGLKTEWNSHDIWDIEKIGKAGKVVESITPNRYLYQYLEEYPALENHLLEGKYIVNVGFEFTDIEKNQMGEFVYPDETAIEFYKINHVFDFKVIGFSNILDWIFVEAD